MDIIVIGREGFKKMDRPQVIYCGDSRSEAKQVAASTGDKFAWIYEVNGMIARNYKTNRTQAAAASIKNDSPKKSKSK